MKRVEEIPVLLKQVYIDYVKLDRKEKATKALKARNKKQLLAFLKKEQTDGLVFNGKKIIQAVTKAGAFSVDKNKLKRDYSSIYQNCLKQGNCSVMLLVENDPNVTGEK